MRYTLNDYVPHLSGKDTRIEVYPSADFAVRLCAEYQRIGAEICPLSSLLPIEEAHVPKPGEITKLIVAFGDSKVSRLGVITGIDWYLTLIPERWRQDFFYGLKSLLNKDMGLRIHISSYWNLDSFFQNPRYEDSLQYVRFSEQSYEVNLPTVTVIPQKWTAGMDIKASVSALLRAMGDYLPDATSEKQMADSFTLALPAFPSDMGYANTITSASQLVKRIFPISQQFPEETCDVLLRQCTEEGKTISDFLEESFHFESLSLEKAPQRLHELRNDKLWPFFAAFVRMRIPQSSYLRLVLEKSTSGDEFLNSYIVTTARRAMKLPHAENYADERKNAFKCLTSAEALIASFVHLTLHDENAIPFLNCGTTAELRGLILHAAEADLAVSLPMSYQKANPLLGYYLSPFFDYGVDAVTKYFHTLRTFRVKNTITKEFVDLAYEASVPKEIRNRKEVLQSFENEDTALLVVDGMGAEYYPLLVKIVENAGIYVEHREIVSAKLPTSTDFNPILWNKGGKLQPVKQPDNISHKGRAAYEQCEYEENLAAVLQTFQTDVMERIAQGWRLNYQRIVITSDHGSSWMAPLARANKLDRDIPWNGPDDWRYTEASPQLEAAVDFERVFRSDLNGKTYFVVRGYNRLPKKGGKLYAVHGGATLEERLVPLVVLANTPAEIASNAEELQMMEKDDFFSLL